MAEILIYANNVSVLVSFIYLYIRVRAFSTEGRSANICYYFHDKQWITMIYGRLGFFVITDCIRNFSEITITEKSFL